VIASYVDVASPDLDFKACSIRLVSLMIFSLRLSNFFGVGFSTGFFLHFSFVFFTVECCRCVLMKNLYFNLLYENHAIIQKWWCYQQEKCIFNVDSPLRGDNGHYSWILGSWCHHHVNEEILIQSWLSLSFW